ncbi:LysM peptidoglycan-binding domain-containing protein [Mesorhizobium sp. 1M-11]|uniref:LysM peptidoglycan-binding domain-containing protein n=1 Tax=Mesorhizobium sp. 1M-11 TaxID=1529006 RepID=UPI0006C7580C|nr:LysM peptidoglycan-binding domain-containing protein [Mesorhizobium sp. 1M-11]
MVQFVDLAGRVKYRNGAYLGPKTEVAKLQAAEKAWRDTAAAANRPVAAANERLKNSPHGKAITDGVAQGKSLRQIAIGLGITETQLKTEVGLAGLKVEVEADKNRDTSSTKIIDPMSDTVIAGNTKNGETGAVTTMGVDDQGNEITTTVQQDGTVAETVTDAEGRQITTTTAPVNDGKPVDYVVAPGDNLTHIAKAHGITLEELAKSNPALFTDPRDPDLIHPGETIVIEDGTQTTITVTTKEGQTVEIKGDGGSDLTKSIFEDGKSVAQVASEQQLSEETVLSILEADGIQINQTEASGDNAYTSTIELADPRTNKLVVEIQDIRHGTSDRRMIDENSTFEVHIPDPQSGDTTTVELSGALGYLYSEAEKAGKTTGEAKSEPHKDEIAALQDQIRDAQKRDPDAVPSLREKLADAKTEADQAEAAAQKAAQTASTRANMFWAGFQQEAIGKLIGDIHTLKEAAVSGTGSKLDLDFLAQLVDGAASSGGEALYNEALEISRAVYSGAPDAIEKLDAFLAKVMDMADSASLQLTAANAGLEVAEADASLQAKQTALADARQQLEPFFEAFKQQNSADAEFNALSAEEQWNRFEQGWRNIEVAAAEEDYSPYTSEEGKAWQAYEAASDAELRASRDLQQAEVRLTDADMGIVEGQIGKLEGEKAAWSKANPGEYAGVAPAQAELDAANDLLLQLQVQKVNLDYGVDRTNHLLSQPGDVRHFNPQRRQAEDEFDEKNGLELERKLTNLEIAGSAAKVDAAKDWLEAWGKDNPELKARLDALGETTSQSSVRAAEYRAEQREELAASAPRGGSLLAALDDIALGNDLNAASGQEIADLQQQLDQINDGIDNHSWLRDLWGEAFGDDAYDARAQVQARLDDAKRLQGRLERDEIDATAFAAEFDQFLITTNPMRIRLAEEVEEADETWATIEAVGRDASAMFTAAVVTISTGNIVAGASAGALVYEAWDTANDVDGLRNGRDINEDGHSSLLGLGMQWLLGGSSPLGEETAASLRALGGYDESLAEVRVSWDTVKTTLLDEGLDLGASGVTGLSTGAGMATARALTAKVGIETATTGATKFNAKNLAQMGTVNATAATASQAIDGVGRFVIEFSRVGFEGKLGTAEGDEALRQAAKGALLGIASAPATGFVSGVIPFQSLSSVPVAAGGRSVGRWSAEIFAQGVVDFGVNLGILKASALIDGRDMTEDDVVVALIQTVPGVAMNLAGHPGRFVQQNRPIPDSASQLSTVSSNASTRLVMPGQIKPGDPAELILPGQTEAKNVHDLVLPTDSDRPSGIRLKYNQGDRYKNEDKRHKAWQPSSSDLAGVQRFFDHTKSEVEGATIEVISLQDRRDKAQGTGNDHLVAELTAKLDAAETRLQYVSKIHKFADGELANAAGMVFERRVREALTWLYPDLQGEARFLNGRLITYEPDSPHGNPDAYLDVVQNSRSHFYGVEVKNVRDPDNRKLNSYAKQIRLQQQHFPTDRDQLGHFVVFPGDAKPTELERYRDVALKLNEKTDGVVRVEDVFFMTDLGDHVVMESFSSIEGQRRGDRVLPYSRTERVLTSPVDQRPVKATAADGVSDDHGDLTRRDGMTASGDRSAFKRSSEADQSIPPDGNLPESNQSRPQSLSAAFHPEGAGQSSDPNAPTIPPALRSAEDKSSKKTGPVDIASEGGLQTSLIMVPEHLTTRPSPQVPNPGTISWPKAQKVEPHTHEDLETLTLPEIESLAEPQISTIPGDQLALVSPGQFRKFTPVQFTWMSKQWDALSVPQLVAFQKTHAGNMTADQKATVDLVLKSAQARELQNAAEIFNPMGASSYTLWSSLPPDWMAKAAVVGFAWRGLAFTAQALFPKTTASHTKLGRFLNGANGISFIVTSPGSAAPFLDTGANPAVNGTFTLGNSIFGTKSTYDAMGARSGLGFASDYIGNIAYLGGSAFYTTQVLSSPSAVTAGTIFTLGSAEFLASAVRKNNTYRRDIPRTDEDIAAAAKADKRWALMDKIALGAFGIGMGLFAYNSLNPDPEEEASRNEESSAPPDFSPEPETKPEPEEHAGEYSQLVVTADEGLNLRALPEQDAEIVAILQPDTFVQQTGEPMADGRRFWVPVEGYATDGSRRQGWVADDYTMLHPEGGRTSQGRVNPELEQNGFEWVEVKPGQTLGGIARGSRRDTAATVMLNLDHIVDPSLLFEGDRIYLPIG